MEQRTEVEKLAAACNYVGKLKPVHSGLSLASYRKYVVGNIQAEII